MKDAEAHGRDRGDGQCFRPVRVRSIDLVARMAARRKHAREHNVYPTVQCVQNCRESATTQMTTNACLALEIEQRVEKCPVCRDFYAV